MTNLTSAIPGVTANTNTKDTLHSIFDYETGNETFPIEVPDRAIASPRPFQIFAIFCMVFLKDQFIYLEEMLEMEDGGGGDGEQRGWRAENREDEGGGRGQNEGGGWRSTRLERRLNEEGHGRGQLRRQDLRR